MDEMELLKVKILFFGATADIAGAREISMEIGHQDTVADVVERIKSMFVTLADRKLLFAINEEYAESDRKLQSGDHLAVFSPVSGG